MRLHEAGHGDRGRRLRPAPGSHRREAGRRLALPALPEARRLGRRGRRRQAPGRALRGPAQGRAAPRQRPDRQRPPASRSSTWWGSSAGTAASARCSRWTRSSPEMIPIRLGTSWTSRRSPRSSSSATSAARSSGSAARRTRTRLSTIASPSRDSDGRAGSSSPACQAVEGPARPRPRVRARRPDGGRSRRRARPPRASTPTRATWRSPGPKGFSAVEGDAAALPFDDASFDVVLSYAVLQRLPNLEAALREARRVLRPGGSLYGQWGPGSLTYNGPRLIKCLGVPWVQLLFSDGTITAALEVQRARGTSPADYVDDKLADFQALGTRHPAEAPQGRDRRRVHGRRGIESLAPSRQAAGVASAAVRRAVRGRPAARASPLTARVACTTLRELVGWRDARTKEQVERGRAGGRARARRAGHACRSRSTARSWPSSARPATARWRR